MKATDKSNQGAIIHDLTAADADMIHPQTEGMGSDRMRLNDVASVKKRIRENEI